MNNIKYMERNQKYNLESNIHLLSQGNETVKNPQKKVFNDYLSTMAEEIETKIKFSEKSFDEVLQVANKSGFFLNLTNYCQLVDEVVSLISSLNGSNSGEPNNLQQKY